MSMVILLDPDTGMPNLRPPLGTLHLAAMLLQAGIKVQLIDCSVQRDYVKVLKEALKGDIICVGISTLIGPMLAHGLELASLVRKMRPKVPIIWGGVHPTTAPESTLKHELVDAICIGEGESTVIEIAEAYRDGRSLHEIPGIGFKAEGKIIFTPPRSEYFNLDILPSLPYHLVDLSLYEQSSTADDSFFRLRGNRLLSIETSRGCPFRCTYCVHSARPEKFRKMSAEKVLQSIEDIVSQGVKSITVNDDNFFVDHQRAMEILSVLIKRNYPLELFVAVRSDYISALDDNDFGVMKSAGIKLLGIGVESGSNSLLKHIQKHETIEDTFVANKRLAQFGINAIFHFIYGFPGETKEDLMLTLTAMHQILNDNSAYARVNLNRLIPNPGSQSYQECLAAGWRSPETIEQWSQVMVTIWRRRPVYMNLELSKFAEPLRTIKFPTNTLPTLKKMIFLYHYRYLFILFRYARRSIRFFLKKINKLLKNLYMKR